jgi:hypothetical protein
MKKIILFFVIGIFLTYKSDAQTCSYLATNFPVGSVPSSVAKGDFNSDGKMDLVTANFGSDDLSILLGNGLGGFSAQTNISVGNQPIFVICADFNNDGKIDLEVANQGSNTVCVLLGNGLGQFSAPTYFPVGSQPTSLAAVDYNNDGIIDLLSANKGSNNISRAPGTGNGGFGQINTTYVGTSPSSLSFNDCNQDNILDLFTANSVSNDVTVALGTGPGNFLSNGTLVVPTNPISILHADFNADGIADIAVANKGSNNVSVLRGNGNGSFMGATNFSVGTQPNCIINTDFNTDGKMDLITVNSGSNNLSILLGNGLGSFAAAITVAVRISPESVISADFNGDGKMDLATANAGSDNVSILLGNGSGGFIVPPQLSGTASVIQNSSCIEPCNGELSINVFGGAPPYSYQWSASAFNQTTAIASGLCASMSHSVTVTDQNDCVLTQTYFIVDVPPVFAVTSSILPNKKCNGVCDGSATVLVDGINSPYTYQWDISALGQTTNTVYNLCDGIYSVIITDVNGCDTTLNVTVTKDTISASISAFPNNKCGGTCNGVAIVLPDGGTPPYTYQWDSLANNQTTDTAYNLCTGTYNLTITDSSDCFFNTQVTIVLIPLVDPNIYLTNLAAIDLINISPSFAAHYEYNLPSTINPNQSNPRNFVDPGKKARFKVECTNNKFNGQSIVSGICKVRSNNPFITITDSSSALNNIAWNGTAWSADEFEIEIDANTPAGTNVLIDFVVQENGQDYSTTCITIPISPLVYSPTTSLTIDDDNNPDSQGNDNDTCNQGEIIEFYPWLDNISTLNAEYVRGQFENLDNHNFINIWNNVPGINTTVYDAGWWNYSFAQPQTITSSSLNTTPEYDFVFDFGNTATANNFDLYMVMSGGFNLFSSSALSLVQWSLPYNFNTDLTTNSPLQVPTISGNTILCEHSDLNLIGSIVPLASSYLWKGPNGFTFSGNNLNLLDINLSSNGEYTYYAIRNGGTENDTSSTSINIFIKPIATLNNPQNICQGGSYSIGTNAYTLSGTYKDTLQSINGCDSIVTTILTVSNPTLSTNVSITDLTLSSLENNATYQWVDCDNNFVFIGGAISQSFSTTSNGNYAVILRSLTCNVSDTSLCFEIDNVSIESLSSISGVNVFPNPTNSSFTIESKTNKIESIRIFDATGKLVFKQKLPQNKVEIDAQKWSDGVYWIEIEVKSGILHQKIIKN